MDLKAEIMKAYSRQQKLTIAAYVGDNQQRFDELMQLFLLGDYRLSQRASNSISYCVEVNPCLIEKHLETFVAQLELPVHDAVRRNVVRVLQFVVIPETLSGYVMNACFNLVLMPDEPVAIKTYALTVLAKLAKTYPEIKKEIKIAIEDQLPRTTAAFHGRAKKILKKL